MSFKVETKLEPINKDNAPTNEKAESCVQLQLEHLEVNLFFDGTWNSKFNSDRYNNASMEEKTNDPKFNPNSSVHDKFHRTLILSGFCLLKIAKISLNSSFFPKPIKR